MSIKKGGEVEEIKPATLYIVATPIGNLQDLSFRAQTILAGVDYIYAEDTRTTARLLQRFEIKTPYRSYREALSSFQLEKVLNEVVLLLKQGKNVAYVSDAGTPGVSDPAHMLVEWASKAGFQVIPIPGASALASIISVSGFSCARPLFVGFLPKKKGRQTLLGQLCQTLADDIADTIIFYESPERIVKLLEELSVWPMPMRVCLGRELTKMHEEIIRGTTDEVLSNLKNRTTIKGEITLAIACQ